MYIPLAEEISKLLGPRLILWQGRDRLVDNVMKKLKRGQVEGERVLLLSNLDHGQTQRPHIRLNRVFASLNALRLFVHKNKQKLGD